MTDGSMSPLPEHAYLGCGSCCICHLHHFHAGVACQEVPALHQSHGMGIHFGDVGPVVLGQAHDAVTDAQLMFTHYGGTTFSEQFVVVQQTSCYGILDGHQGYGILVLMEAFKHLLEGIKA